jgi:hypothetical protein
MNLVVLVEERERDCPSGASTAGVNRVIDGCTALFGSTGVTIGRFLTIVNRTGAFAPSVVAVVREACPLPGADERLCTATSGSGRLATGGSLGSCCPTAPTQKTQSNVEIETICRIYNPPLQSHVQNINFTRRTASAIRLSEIVASYWTLRT